MTNHCILSRDTLEVERRSNNEKVERSRHEKRKIQSKEKKHKKMQKSDSLSCRDFRDIFLD